MVQNNSQCVGSSIRDTFVRLTAQLIGECEVTSILCGKGDLFDVRDSKRRILGELDTFFLKPG